MPQKPAALFLLAAAVTAWLLPGAVCAAAADKLDAIKARGKLLVGVTESSPPFSYRDDGKGIVGYDVDLAGARSPKGSASPPKMSRSSMPTALPRCSRTTLIWSPSA